MNTLCTDGFVADWQANGNLRIKALHSHIGIIISREDAEKLAKFILWPPVPKQECDTKVDYSRCAGEPE